MTAIKDSSLPATSMYTAAMTGPACVVATLLQLGKECVDVPTNYGWTPMFIASLLGHASVVETLFLFGSEARDIRDNTGRTPLFAATENGCLETIETLVRLGSCDFDTKDNSGRTPIFKAMMNGKRDAVLLFMSLGACRKSLYSIPEWKNDVDLLESLVDNDEHRVLSTRERIYFSYSLLTRILVQLERQSEINHR